MITHSMPVKLSKYCAVLKGQGLGENIFVSLSVTILSQ